MAINARILLLMLLSCVMVFGREVIYCDAKTPMVVTTHFGETPQITISKETRPIANICLENFRHNIKNGDYVIEYQLSIEQGLTVESLDTKFEGGKQGLDGIGLPCAVIPISGSFDNIINYAPILRIKLSEGGSRYYTILMSIPSNHRDQYTLERIATDKFILSRRGTLNEHFKKSIDGYSGYPNALSASGVLYNSIPDLFRLSLFTETKDRIVKEEGFFLLPQEPRC